MNLPIIAYKKNIIEAVQDYAFTMITAETGSGAVLNGANATVAIKDNSGANVNYPSDTESMIPYRPTAGNTDGSENTADKAEAAGAYIDLVVEEGDIEKLCRRGGTTDTQGLRQLDGGTGTCRGRLGVGHRSLAVEL